MLNRLQLVLNKCINDDNTVVEIHFFFKENGNKNVEEFWVYSSIVKWLITIKISLIML